MARVKVMVNYKVSPVVEQLLSSRTVVIDDGALSRQLSRTLEPLRKRGNLVVGHDRQLGKSVLTLMGMNGHRKKKRVGGSIFEIRVD